MPRALLSEATVWITELAQRHPDALAPALAQRLIELRKERWELALYPAEDHAFERETSWADEYKRILTLFETYLE